MHTCAVFVGEWAATESVLSSPVLNTKQIVKTEPCDKWDNIKESDFNKPKQPSAHNKCEWIKAFILKDKDFHVEF